MGLRGPEASDDDESGYIFANDFVIFDEAHTVEAVAARQIGIGVSQYGLRYALHRLYNPKTRKGIFQVLRRPDAVREVSSILDELDAFFERIGKRADFRKGREFRVRAPDFVEDSLSGPLAKLQQLIVQCVRTMQDEIMVATYNWRWPAMRPWRSDSARRSARRHCQEVVARPTISAARAKPRAVARAGFRRHQRQSFSGCVMGRARIGSWRKTRPNSSANSCAVW